MRDEVQKAAVGGVTRAVVTYVALNYVLPLIGPAVAVGLGLLNDVPLFWTWFGALGCFAFAMVGTTHLMGWLHFNRIEGKLQFAQTLVAREITSPSNLVVGLRLVSTSAFPIAIEIDKLSTRLADRVPSEQRFAKTEFSVDPGGTFWFYDHAITPAPTRDQTVEGFIEYSLRYGRPGSVSHILQGKKQVLVRFDQDGNFESATWQEAT